MYKHTNSFTGNYLSWIHAQKNGDPLGTGKFLNRLTDKISDKELILNTFSSSLLLNDWNIAIKLAKKIVSFDKNNFFANIILSTHSFNEKQYSKSLDFIENIYVSSIDESFLKIISSWIHLQNKKNQIALENFKNENCLPITCLHSALIYDQIGKKEIAKKNFDKILERTDSSLRITEILYSFYSSNSFDKQVSSLKKKFEKKNGERKYFFKNNA